MIVTNSLVQMTPHLYIENDPIVFVNNFRYLGINIDNKLKFQTQVDYLNGRLSQLCGISFRLKQYFNFDAAKKFYYAFVYSVLTYGIAVWGGVILSSNKCARLDRLHSKIIFNLFSSFYPNSECLYKEVGILKLNDIYKLRICIYMYRALNTNMYPSLSNSLTISYPAYRYPTSSKDQIILPFPSTQAIRFNYKYLPIY